MDSPAFLHKKHYSNTETSSSIQHTKHSIYLSIGITLMSLLDDHLVVMFHHTLKKVNMLNILYYIAFLKPFLLYFGFIKKIVPYFA